MNIYERLIEDHGKQRGMAAGLLQTEGDSAERRRLFETFKTELETHANAEEQSFYSELMSHADGQEKARHSVTEHKTTADLLKKLEETDMSSGAWLQTFKKLKHEVEHHLDEEENKVFPLAKGLIPGARAEALVDLFESRKQMEIEEA